MLFSAPGKAEKKKWKELKLLKKLEKQRMRELEEQQAQTQEEQKEDRGDAAVTRWGDLGRKCSKTWLLKGSKCYLSIGMVLLHRSRVDQPTCPNRHKHCAATTALEIFLMRKPTIKSKKPEVAFPPPQ